MAVDARYFRVITFILEDYGFGRAAIEGQDTDIRRQWRWMRCN
jgi:hypothetical protein